MVDWPLTLDGRHYQPIPESWVEHGADLGTGSPRLYAVSVAHDAAADILRVRYAHPTDAHVLETTTGACEHDGSVVPCGLPSKIAQWPRSLVPSEGVSPTGLTRRPEPAHLRELWADRVAAIDVDPAVPDGGTSRAIDAYRDVTQLHFSDFTRGGRDV
jgi:hypothetical protein